MNCTKAQRLAALHAGGDLPEKLLPELTEHLDRCPGCAKQFEELKHSLHIIGTTARTEDSVSVPVDLALSIHNRIVREKPIKHGTGIFGGITELLKRKPAIAVSFAIIMILLVSSISVTVHRSREQMYAQVLAEVQRMAERNRSEIEPSLLALPEIEGPFPFDEWEQSDESGVFAILHKSGTGPYIVDYIGESEKLLYRGFPFINQKKEHLLERAGSTDNVYIAVYPMPESTGRERKRIEQYLIRKYRPFLNNGV